MKLLLLAFALVFVPGFGDAGFPDEPKPCKQGDANCITKAINFLLHDRYKGDKSLNFPDLDPYPLSNINIKQEGNSAVNIDLNFKKNNLYGLNTAEVSKVKGFGKDLKEKHEIFAKIKTLNLIGDYSISGKILVLPISGSGKSNMTIVNSKLHIIFTGTPVEKDGKTYMNINDMSLTLEPERLYYSFQNLFNDKELSGNMNLFLNENWKEIYNEVKGILQQTLANRLQIVTNGIFGILPYEDFFEKE